MITGQLDITFFCSCAASTADDLSYSIVETTACIGGLSDLLEDLLEATILLSLFYSGP